MNNLARILLGSASAAAIMFGVQAGARADSLSVGGGTITYGAGGVPADNTPADGGASIETIDNDTVTIDSLTIDKTAAHSNGEWPNALSIVNENAGGLSAILAGTSHLTEESTDQAAALLVYNTGPGETLLDTSAAHGNSFVGYDGIDVEGTGALTKVVLGADTINAITDGSGVGLYVNGGHEIDISTNAVIGSDASHLFNYGIQAEPDSFGVITIDSAARISAVTADIYVDSNVMSINNYGTLDTATYGILADNGATANISLFAGSSTGPIDISGDDGGSTVSLWTGMGTANPGQIDRGTDAVMQAAGTLAPALFGTIAADPSDELDLRGGGDGTVENGAAGRIDLSSIGGISGFSTIVKKDSGTWQFLNGAGDAATHQARSIFLEQGTIQAMAEGAFGGGAIQIDNSGGASDIEYSATGTYANAIALNVTAPTFSTGAHITVDDGVTATLSGAITSIGSDQTVVFNGPGTAVLTNTGNAWTGGTQISGAGTLILTGANTYSGTTIIGSGATLKLAGSGALSSGDDIEIDGGTFDVATNGQTVGNIVGTGGNLTLEAYADLTATSISGTQIMNLALNTTLTVGGLSGNGSISFLDNNLGFYVGDSNNTEYDGNISAALADDGNIYKRGVGTLTLGGDDRNYAGYIEIDGGTLRAGSITAFGDTNIRIASGATLDLNGFNSAIDTLRGSGTVTDGSVTPVTLELHAINDATFDGVIEDGAGKISLQIDGSTLTLTGANTYTGKTMIENGATLVLSGGGSIANGNDIEIDGGTFSVVTGDQTVGNITGTGGNVLVAPGIDFGAAALTGSQAVTVGDGSALTVNSLSGSGSIFIDGGTNSGAIFMVGDTNNTTYNGNISSAVGGSEAIYKEGIGTLTFGGDNTNYTGSLVLIGGTLQAGSDTAFGTFALYTDPGTTLDMNGFNGAIDSLHGLGTVTDGSMAPATLELYDSDLNGVFYGVIQDGAGRVSVQVDAGTLTLGGANTFSGALTIENGANVVLTGNGSVANASVNDLGTLDMSAATAPAASVLGSLAGNGTVNLATSNLTITNGSGAFSGTLNGLSNLTVTGGVFTAGTNAVLNTANVTLAGGGLGYGNGVNLANAIVLSGDNAQLQVGSGTATQSGAITETGGARDLDKTGNGTLVVTTPVAYTGTTDVEAGTLQAGVANAFASSSNIIVSDGAKLDLGGFDQSFAELSGAGDIDLGSSRLTVGSDNASTRFSGVLSGTGSLVKTGTGTLVLSGDNTYSGETIIAGGTIDAESDHAFGTGAVTMRDPVLTYGNSITISNAIILAANDAQLRVAAGTAAQAGVISETGSARPLEKIGAGALILSAMNTYTGVTTVTAGTLDITGSIAPSSLVTVKSGATLTGTGTVGNTNVAGGATFVPGGMVGGPMNVHGNLTFASDSNYDVSINPASASQANVSGTASLGGATVNATYGSGSYVEKQYTILTAGTVSGTFGSAVNTDLPSNFTPTLSYDGKHAYLNLALSFTPPSPPSFGNGLAGNRNRVGNTLIDYFNRTGGLPLAFGSLTSAGLTAVSGEVAVAAVQTSKDVQDEFLNAMLDPALAGATSGVEGNSWHVWGNVFGGGRTTAGSASAGSNDTTAHALAGAAGAYHIFNPGLLAGLAFSSGNTTYSVTRGLGSGRSSVYQGGAYAHQDVGDAGYIVGAIAFGSQRATTHRTLDESSVTGSYSGHYSADTSAGRLEAGWRFDADGSGLTPYIAWQTASESVPGYSEKTVGGSSLFALDYHGREFDSSRGEIGLRADQTFSMDGGALTVHERTAWVDNFQLDHAIGAGFEALSGTSFTVDGAAEGRNVGLAGISGEWQWGNGVSLAGSVTGAFSNKSTAYVASGTLFFTW